MARTKRRRWFDPATRMTIWTKAGRDLKPRNCACCSGFQHREDRRRSRHRAKALLRRRED